jgi:hypothetical protein
VSKRYERESDRSSRRSDHDYRLIIAIEDAGAHRLSPAEPELLRLRVVAALESVPGARAIA